MPQYAKALEIASRPAAEGTALTRPYALAVLGLAAFLACLTVDSMLAAPNSVNSRSETHHVVVRSLAGGETERREDAEWNAASRPRFLRALLVAGLVSTSGWWWHALLERLGRSQPTTFDVTVADIQRATDLPVLGKLFPLDDAPATTIVLRRTPRGLLLAAELVIAVAWAIPAATVLAQPEMLARYRENPIAAYCESIEQIVQRLGGR